MEKKTEIKEFEQFIRIFFLNNSNFKIHCFDFIDETKFVFDESIYYIKDNRLFFTYVESRYSKQFEKEYIIWKRKYKLEKLEENS